MNQRVVVIIPAKNVASTLGEQLEALDAQTDLDFRVVVSDNGSSDDTRKIAEEWTPRHRGISVADSSHRPGVAGARNAAIEATQEELILICDGDDRVHPTWVAAMRNALARTDAASGPLHAITPGSSDPGTVWFPEGLPLSMNFKPFLPGGNMGFHRAVIRRIGPFDEELYLGQEDVDFGWRMHDAGLRMAHVPEAGIDYRLRPGWKPLLRQQYRYGKAHVRLYLKHRPNTPPVASWKTSARWFWHWAKQLPKATREGRLRVAVGGATFQLSRVLESLRHGTRSPL